MPHDQGKSPKTAPSGEPSPSAVASPSAGKSDLTVQLKKSNYEDGCSLVSPKKKGIGGNLAEAGKSLGSLLWNAGGGILNSAGASVTGMGTNLWSGAGHAADTFGMDGSYFHDKAAGGQALTDELSGNAKHFAGEAMADLEESMVYAGTAGENITEAWNGDELSEVDPSRFMDDEHKATAGDLTMKSVTVINSLKSMTSVLKDPTNVDKLGYTLPKALNSAANTAKKTSGAGNDAATSAGSTNGPQPPLGASVSSGAGTAASPNGASGPKSDRAPDTATRQGFVQMLAASYPAQVATRLSTIVPGGTITRPHDPILRAEAAEFIRRALNTGVAPSEGKTAFFIDVPPSAWFFDAAHVARMYGVFKGAGDNTFRGGEALQRTHAMYVIERFGSAELRPPEAQRDSPDIAVQTKPSDVYAMLSRPNLSVAEIRQVREMIAGLPETARPAAYKLLATKVSSRNQRNNAGKYVTGDYMCNMTSLASVLEGLGIENPRGDKQFEDALDEMLKEQKLGGSRYTEAGQNNVAKEMGAAGERLSFPGPRSAQGVQDWLVGTIRPRLEAGAQATMSILAYGDGHIVRLEWVEDDGAKVDDPFGTALTSKNEGFAGYKLNSTKAESGEGTYGEDNMWTWQFLAKQLRYVHLFTNG